MMGGGMDSFYFSGDADRYPFAICPVAGGRAEPDRCAWGVPVDDGTGRHQCCGLLYVVQCTHDSINDIAETASYSATAAHEAAVSEGGE